MTFDEFKIAVAKAAADMGITDYELYCELNEETAVQAFKSEVSGFTSNLEGGVCLRCAVDGKMGYASTESLSVAEAARLVRRSADNAATLEETESAQLVPAGQIYEEREAKSYPLPAGPELTDTVLKIQELLKNSDPAVLDTSRSAAFSGKSTVSIFNSRGLDLTFTAGSAGFMAMPIVSDGKEIENAYEIAYGDFATLDQARTVKKAVDNARAKLGGDVPATGSVPVVFSPDAMASLLATYASAFSSESALKGLTPLAGKEGEDIASPAVTLVDDPFFPESPMPIPFDAEGSPAHKKNIIEAGRLTTLLYNRKTAAQAGRETTGNAAKSGYASKVGVRPFTMYLAPGELSEDELLEKAENGVYINMLGGLHAGANVISGDFSLQSGGFLIENGKKTVPVKSFTVAGSFFELLKHIVCVGSNLELPSPEGITNFASPSVLVEGLTIAGK